MDDSLDDLVLESGSEIESDWVGVAETVGDCEIVDVRLTESERLASCEPDDETAKLIEAEREVLPSSEGL